MGNCCKKKTKEEGKPGSGDYVRIKDGTVSKVGATITGEPTSNLSNGPDTARDEEGGHFKGRAMNLEEDHPKLDDACLQLIKDLGLDAELDTVKERVHKFSKEGLTKLTDDGKDTFTMFLDIKADEKKETFHTTVAHLKSHLQPLAFKLANTLISEADEIRMTPNYERFYTIFRAKIDDVYYIINYALYKKIMLMSQKDLLFLKAFKKLDNGDVVEITVSINHPEFEEKAKIDRMKLIQSIGHFKKTDSGTEGTTVSQIYPRTSVGMTMLKPIFTKSFRSYFKTLDEYLLTIKSEEGELSSTFQNFTKKNF